MLRHLLYVAVGGAIGSVLRFLVSVGLSHWYKGNVPAATFIVNVTGCFLIGLILAQLPTNENGQSMRFLLVTGFCGGYTTFSAFAYENIRFLQSGNTSLMVGYIFASVVVGIAAVWLGLKTA